MNPRLSAPAAALLLAATVACSDVTPTQPLVAPADASLAKQGTTGSRMLYYDFGNVWIMNEDGTGATPLTISGDGAYDPSWAPDGKRVLFNAYKGAPEASIYTMNADGSAVTRITYPPAGSIDTRPTKFGKAVAFVRNFSAIYRVNVDGSGEGKIADGAAPAGSPGGTRLAYVSNGDIYEYDATTGQSVNLTNTPNTFENDPSYAPNGKQIVFAADTPNAGIRGIYVMRVDGTAVTRLAWTSTGSYELPRWSPDGKRIAFSHSPAQFGAQDIYAMNADGSGVTNLTQSAGSMDLLTAWAR